MDADAGTRVLEVQLLRSAKSGALACGKFKKKRLAQHRTEESSHRLTSDWPSTLPPS